MSDTIVIQDDDTSVVETSGSSETQTLVVTTAPAVQTIEVAPAAGPPGPPGPVGPQGPPGGGVASFDGRNGVVTLLASDIIPLVSFSQGFQVAALSFDVNHNLGFYPAVVFVDTAGGVCIGDISYVDANNLTITFSSEISGTVYCT
jgi:hypothetical protein